MTQNDEAERLACVLDQNARGEGSYKTRSAALLRTQAERIAELEEASKARMAIFSAQAQTLSDLGAELSNAVAEAHATGAERETWKARAEAAEAEVARLREAQTQAATDVLAERQRQISAEGWTPGHDDAHMFGEMATAASSYAAAAGVEAPLRDLIERGKSFPENWPWSKDWWKPTTRRRDLVKAGALILAEIERLDRAALQPKEGE